MTGKRDIKVLTEILDLSDVKVISHRLDTGIGMILQIEQEKSFSTCPKCGTTSHKLHQNHRHIIKRMFEKWYSVIFITLLPPLVPLVKGGNNKNPVPSPLQGEG